MAKITDDCINLQIDTCAVSTYVYDRVVSGVADRCDYVGFISL
jgi:hypothetical protein